LDEVLFISNADPWQRAMKAVGMMRDNHDLAANVFGYRPVDCHALGSPAGAVEHDR
jgi:hypothetical protein